MSNISPQTQGAVWLNLKFGIAWSRIPMNRIHEEKCLKNDHLWKRRNPWSVWCTWKDHKRTHVRQEKIVFRRAHNGLSWKTTDGLSCKTTENCLQNRQRDVQLQGNTWGLRWCTRLKDEDASKGPWIWGVAREEQSCLAATVSNKGHDWRFAIWEVYEVWEATS